MNPYRRVGKTIFVPNTIKTKFKSDLWVRSKDIVDIARRCITDHEPVMRLRSCWMEAKREQMYSIS